MVFEDGRDANHASTQERRHATDRREIFTAEGKSPRFICSYKLDRGNPVVSQTSFIRSNRMAGPVCLNALGT